MFLSPSRLQSKFALPVILAMFCLTTLCMGIMPIKAYAAGDSDKTTIKLGVIEGSEMDIWKVAARYAKEKEGLNIVLIPFSEYILPNEALNDGEIDANAFQHKAYLDAQIEQRGYKITPVGDTSLFPMGVYSRKVKSLDALPKGAVIGIPDDPANEGRALRLMAQKGFITLDDPKNIFVTPIDVKDNPKNFSFQEMDSGILGRSINDMDAIIMNNTWIKATGINPAQDRIALESVQNNPYVNFIAVRTKDAHKPWIKKLVTAYQNDDVRQALKKAFGDNVITPW